MVELYRFSRPLWPRVGSAAFARTLRSFLKGYMGRRFGTGPRDWKVWTVAAIVGVCAATRIVNPETLSFGSLLSTGSRPPLPVEPPRAGRRTRE